MEEYTISEIHGLMDAGKLTGVQLVQQYLDQIDKIDRAGPKLNSIIELNPDALELARELDNQFQKSGKIGPLHGIPVLIKDNFDTADQMKTTAGSLSIEKYGGNPVKDAFVVQKLREAGAIILGKTNLSEMANFRGQRSTSGWSSRGGRTRNPYCLDRNPSGSSSGSGVAVAANLCTVALGTETDGSVISPAQTNGVVGIKPTIGLISRTGIVPIAASQDTAGPMARTVRDAAVLLGAMVGSDPEDEVTGQATQGHTDYTQFLDDQGLQGARLGVLRKHFGFHKDVKSELEQALDVLKNQGAELIDVEFEPPEDWEGSMEFTVLLYEYKEGLNNYFATRKDSQIKTIEDLIRFNKEDAQHTMPYFGQEHVEGAAEKGGLDEEEYQKAMQMYQAYRETLLQLMEEHQLDALVAPSGGPSWVTDLVNGDHFGGGSSSYAAITGFSNITVPAGHVHGLPIGLSFIAGPFAEPTILKLAYAFEQATHHRQPPQFLETIE